MRQKVLIFFTCISLVMLALYIGAVAERHKNRYAAINSIQWKFIVSKNKDLCPFVSAVLDYVHDAEGIPYAEVYQHISGISAEPQKNVFLAYSVLALKSKSVTLDNQECEQMAGDYRNSISKK